MKDQINLNCFHNLFWRAYGHKLKIAYEHVIGCFYKLSHTVSLVFIPTDKLD